MDDNTTQTAPEVKRTQDNIPAHITRRYYDQIAAFNGIQQAEINRRVFQRWEADGFPE